MIMKQNFIYLLVYKDSPLNIYINFDCIDFKMRALPLLFNLIHSLKNSQHIVNVNMSYSQNAIGELETCCLSL